MPTFLKTHQVSRDPATGRYAADTELGGGPGCSDESGWELGHWRRLDPRNGRVNGRLYLPSAARNATTITVKCVGRLVAAG